MNKKIEIPEGYNARIEGNSIILEPKESEDEKIRKKLIDFVSDIKRIADSGRAVALPDEDIELCGQFLDYLEKQKEQQPAEWSEEDEERLDSIIESYKDLLQDYKACHDVDYILYNSNTVIRNVVDDITFLKSLRPSWKPNKEQMKALYSLVFDGGITYVSQLSYLTSLYKDLKKL